MGWPGERFASTAESACEAVEAECSLCRADRWLTRSEVEEALLGGASRRPLRIAEFGVRIRSDVVLSGRCAGCLLGVAWHERSSLARTRPEQIPLIADKIAKDRH